MRCQINSVPYRSVETAATLELQRRREQATVVVTEWPFEYELHQAAFLLASVEQATVVWHVGRHRERQRGRARIASEQQPHVGDSGLALEVELRLSRWRWRRRRQLEEHLGQHDATQVSQIEPEHSDHEIVHGVAVKVAVEGAELEKLHTASQRARRSHGSNDERATLTTYDRASDKHRGRQVARFEHLSIDGSE